MRSGLNTRQMVLLKVGRTVWGLQSGIPKEEIEALREQYGTSCEEGWDDLTASQKIDTIATKILVDDRIELRKHYDGVGEHPLRHGVLSEWQFYDRTIHEMPVPDIETIEAIRQLVRSGPCRAVHRWWGRYRPNLEPHTRGDGQ